MQNVTKIGEKQNKIEMEQMIELGRDDEIDHDDNFVLDTYIYKHK